MGGEMSIPYREFKARLAHHSCAHRTTPARTLTRRPGAPAPAWQGVCEQIFLCLRRRPSFFATLLLALVPDVQAEQVATWEFSIDDLHREIVHRFMPGLSDPEAAASP